MKIRKKQRHITIEISYCDIRITIGVVFYCILLHIFVEEINDRKLYSYKNRIRVVLEERGIKQIWLTERLGKSFCMVNTDVCNRRQSSLEFLFEIVKMLDVNPKK